jgi:hypothetical protein
MDSPDELIAIKRELDRLGVPSHEGGRLWTFDSAALPGREILRRLRALPNGAGADAVNQALLASD